VNALLHRYEKLSTVGGNDRFGIVHRLDKDTSGLMVIAKDNETHEFLKEQFSSRKVIKKYEAIVIGRPKNNGGLNVIDRPIIRHPKDINKMVISIENNPKAKNAITDYIVKKEWIIKKEIFTHLNIQIHTGRTHQIRVHMASNGTPIVGDTIYSRKHAKYGLDHLLLISKSISLKHPQKKEEISFEIPLSQHMDDFIQHLNQLESAPNSKKS